ncbi:hypothetical protein [Thalassoglobus sp.]|uniref:hypothetical protein n=1 Tax=Thalassoglobus sp. TaxID=2795869 RepID=UPI003AA89719
MNKFWNCVSNRRFQSALIAVVVWAIMFPEDLQVILVPVQELLSVTKSLSLGVYLLVSTIVICRTWREVSSKVSGRI